jgi:hypothetical protein
MSFAEILEQVDLLTDEERKELALRLRAKELANDANRTADMSTKLDRMLAGVGVVTEEELHARLRARGIVLP